MKVSRRFFKVIVFLIISLQMHNLYGQENYIDVKTLPFPDCQGVHWTKFDKNPDKLVVIPDNPSGGEDFVQVIEWHKKRKIKKESEMTEDDYTKPLFVLGVMKDFKKWDKLRVPFKQTKNGFLFENKQYNNLSDGFCYMDSTKLVWSGNSMAPVLKLNTTPAGFYKSIIIEEGLLSKYILFTGEEIDLKKIRETNYISHSNEYVNFYIDKKLEGKVDFSPSIVEDICKKLELKQFDSKFNAFAHGNPNATRLFANFYGAKGCDNLILQDDDVFATVQLDGIHVTGTDVGYIKHEAVHMVWNKSVAPANGEEFFNEGIQTYYEFLCDSSRIDNALAIQRKYMDYDITDLVTKGDNQAFWSSPSENGSPIGYKISGLFVKYLVDGWGLDTFKLFFKEHTRKRGEVFVKFYGKTAAQLIADYKQTVRL